MRVRVRALNELSDQEREQLAENFIWTDDHDEAQHWLVTLENNAVAIGFLVPRADEQTHVSLN